MHRLPSRPFRFALTSALCGLLAAALLPSASAQSSWTAAGGNNLVSNANNWSPTGAPVNNGTATLSFGSQTASVAGVSFDSAYSILGASFTGTSAYSIVGSPLTIGANGVANTATTTIGTSINFGNSVTLANNATLSTATGNLNFSAVNNAGNSLTLSSTGGAISINGNLTGTGSVTIAGNGPGIVFYNSTGNSYSGGTTINSGLSLQIGNPNGSSVGSLPGNVTNNGQINFKPVNASFSYSGVISGTGNLSMIGTNTLTLSGANTYGGTTSIIAGGTIAVGTMNALPTTTTLSMGTGSTLIVANNQTIAGFSGNQPTSIIKIDGGHSLTVALGNGTSNSFQGTITDGATAGGQFRVGPGLAHTVTLLGANTYSGGTEIDGGVLRLGNNGTSGSIQGNVNFTSNGGTLIFHRSDDVTFNGVISGAGGIAQGVSSSTTSGTTRLTAANTYTGGTLVSGGTLLVQNSSGSATGTGAVVVTAAVPSLRATFGGAGTITGTLTVNANGTVFPTALLNVGATTLNGGTRFAWVLSDANAAAGVGSGLLGITGGLTLNATPTFGQELTIAPTTFNGSVAGLAANFNGSQNYSFVLASTTTGITGFDVNSVLFDLSGFQNSYNGTWSVATSLDGMNLLLNYTASAIPEPAETAALVGALAIGLVVLKRRSKKTPSA